jgi:uncharacterized protein (TIGR02145 family)
MKKNLMFFAVVTMTLSFVFTSCKKDNKDTINSVTGVVLTPSVATLSVGDTLRLSVVVLPETAFNKTVVWSTSNSAVVSVVDGKVTASSTGQAIITVTTQDGNKTANCTLTIMAASHPPHTIPTCNNTSAPGWGQSFGVVYFATDQEFSISGNDITQIWSDAVHATNCYKSNYNGGLQGNYSSDCRSNPSQKGDLFSWCAIARYEKTLCPGDWRVPTKQDFINLDIALGGSGQNGQTIGSANVTSRYRATWNGNFGGYCDTSGSLGGQNSSGFYWAQEEDDERDGIYLGFNSAGNVDPNGWLVKSFGLTLRCVR